jgi:two-component system nitrogen regulation response regulator GlnG
MLQIIENADVIVPGLAPSKHSIQDTVGRLLFIGGQPALVSRRVLEELAGACYCVDVVNTGVAGVEQVRNQEPDVIILDLHLPDECGLEVHRQIRRINPRIPVIFVTMARSADAAIEAMKQGAFDYLFRPLDAHQLRRAVDQAMDVALQAPSMMDNGANSSGLEADSSIFGSCQAMRDVYKSIGRVAAQNVPVLVTGESGTGKELVARALWQHSSRSKAPFPGPQLRGDPRATARK